MKSTRFASLCSAIGLTFLSIPTLHAQFIVDGTREAAYGVPVAVQTVSSSWGTNNTLASLSVKQDGSKLYVFVAGRADGNSLQLFIDSKTGGANKLVNGLVNGGDDEWRIHNFALNGSSTTDGMTFESDFSADYAINIQSGGWTSLFPLNPSSPQPRAYIGNVNDAGGASGGVVTIAKRNTGIGVSDVATHANGWEFEFNISSLGVGTGEAEPVKFLAFIITDGVNGSPNQVLGPLPNSTDLGGWGTFQTQNFETITGVQAVTVTVSNADADSDGIPNSTDSDDDNDGLSDIEEEALGTNPLSADTDQDGRNDKSEVDVGTDPLKKNYSSLLIAGDFLNPTWSDAVTSENTMTLVSGEQFKWQLSRRFTSAATLQYKYLAGSWSTNWGASATPGTAAVGGGNISNQILATGLYTFEFNNDTLAYTFTRATKPGTYAAWATAMGVTGTASDDDDSDGLSNQGEYDNDCDPLNNDTDGDGLTDNFEVTGFNDFSIATSPITPDTDGDGLRDAWELQYGLDPTDNGTALSYVNNTGLTVIANPNGGNGDPDGDTLTNAQEQTAGTNPLAPGTGFASAFPKITVPGSFNGFNAGGNAVNTMQLVGNFSWKLIAYFAAPPTGNSEYKFAAGSWDTNWGPSATPGVAELSTFSNIQASSVLTAAGYFVFTFNDSTLAYSLAPLDTTDADNNGLPDEWEAYYGGYLNPKLTSLDPATAYVAGSTTTAAEAFSAGTNPVQDTTPPTIELASGVPALTWIALNGTLPAIAAADVVAADNLGTPTVGIAYNVNGNNVTSIPVDEPATAIVTYTATDADGNAASVARTIVIGDAAPGWRAMNWPASLTLTTVGSGNIYGQIFVDGATATVGAAPGIQAWVGVNAANTDPATWDASAWTAASFNAQSNANDEYVGTISGASLTPGTYYYAYRWQIGSAAYFYGGIQADGSGAGPWDGTTNGNGVLTVNAAVLRDVTFAVDMGVQAFRGTFTPGTDSVYVVGDVSDWTTGVVMTREGETSVYKATLNLEGTENATRNYKFRSSVSGFEGDLDPGVPGDTTRVLTLGTANVAQTLDTATFNNQTEARKVTFRVDMSIQEQLGNFDPNTGTVKVAGSFNGWTGVALTAQGNGIYAGEIVIDGPISGVTYKFLANDAYESVAGDRTLSTSLLNLTATTLDPVYFSDVSQVGSTFSGWSGGATLDATNLGKYAIGGASSLSATDGVKPTSTVSGGNLVLTAIVRVDDPKLSVFGEVVTSLANYGTPVATTMIDGADAADQTGVPAGHKRQTFTVPQGADGRKFLRLKATLTP
jgi:hypothetical protein